MTFKNIEKYSFGYTILKHYVGMGLHVYYRKITISGKRLIPKKQAVIFAINHQQALMDALVTLWATPLQPVFLARSDIFKSRTNAIILKFLKIMPIYRQRDNVELVKKNEEIFQKTIDVLENHKALGIMPEGAHGNKRRLMPLKKGVGRIAFKAAERSDFQLKLYVVPVGLDFSHYIHFRSRVLVNFGESIPVHDYYDLYKENPAKAINHLTKEIRRRLPYLMIDIQNKELYEMYNDLRLVFNTRMRERLGIKKNGHYEQFVAGKNLIAALDREFEKQPERLRNLASKVKEYKNGLKKLDLRDWVFRKPNYSWFRRITKALWLTVSAPVALYGWLNNYFPYHIPVRFTRKVKDKQFHSSFKFVLGLLLFPAFYLVQFLIVFLLEYLFTDVNWIKYAYLLSLPLSGLAAFEWYISRKKLNAKWRYARKVKQNDTEITELQKLRKAIIQETDEIVDLQE